MKRIFLILCSALMLCCFSVYAEQEDTPIKVIVNGEQVMFPDQQPVIIKDRTLVPMRGIFDALNLPVRWLEDPQMIKTKTAQGDLTFRIGSRMVNKNNNQVIMLEVAPQIINNRTMVPVRFIAESTGATAEWIESTRTVEISTK